MTDALSHAVQQAIAATPCSMRALARAAGVPHVTLVHIASGKRRATLAVAAKIAPALVVWARTQLQAAERIRRGMRGPIIRDR